MISRESLLQNEASFDRLFCDVLTRDKFSIFFNYYFSDDPIFNHANFSGTILESLNYNSSQVQEILKEIVNKTKDFEIPASIYMERFWKNAKNLERDAIECEFMIIEQMHILTKEVRKSTEKPDSGIEVLVTREPELWNNAFIKSFQIPKVWVPELRRRLGSAINDPSTKLLIAKEKERSEASGCLLLHNTPGDCMGVYCVGTIPERRSRGIARAMMAEAELEAERKNCDILLLQTVASDGVTPMYLRMGYEIAFERDVLQYTR